MHLFAFVGLLCLAASRALDAFVTFILTSFRPSFADRLRLDQTPRSIFEARRMGLA